MVERYDADELLALIEGELAPDREQQLREELAMEPALLAAIDRLCTDRQLVASAEVPEPPLDLMSRLEPFLARPMLVEGPAHEFQRRRHTASPTWPRYAAAAGIGVALIAGLFAVIAMLNSGSSSDLTNESTVAASSDDTVTNTNASRDGAGNHADAPPVLVADNDQTKTPGETSEADTALAANDDTATAAGDGTNEGDVETVIAGPGTPKTIEPIVVSDVVIPISDLIAPDVLSPDLFDYEVPVAANFTLVVQAEDTDAAVEVLKARIADLSQMCLVQNWVGGTPMADRQSIADTINRLKSESSGPGTVTDRIRRAQKRAEEQRRLAEELEGAKTNLIAGAIELAPSGGQQERYLERGARFTLTIPASQLQEVLAALSLNERELRTAQRLLRSSDEPSGQSGFWLEYAAVQQSIRQLLELEDDRLIHVPITFEPIADHAK